MVQGLETPRNILRLCRPRVSAFLNYCGADGGDLFDIRSHPGFRTSLSSTVWKCTEVQAPRPTFRSLWAASNNRILRTDLRRSILSCSTRRSREPSRSLSESLSGHRNESVLRRQHRTGIW